MTYKIVTDSTTDLPKHIIEAFDIKVLNMKFHIGEETYENNLIEPELPYQAFYDEVKKGALPTTSQLTPNDYEVQLEPLLAEGNHLLILSFSSALSGSYNSGRIAVDTLKESYPHQKITIIDTKAASLGEGLLVYLAALEKNKGKSFEEVETFVNDTLLHIAHWFTVDDISHLRRGGRISRVSSVIARTLNIKPIMHVNNEGKLIPRFKAIGRNKSIKVLFEQMKKVMLTIEQTIFIGHGDDEKSALKLKALIQKELEIEDVQIYPIGPVIGAHAGQGVLALFFQATER